MDRVEPGEVQGILSRLVREKGFLERVFEALQEGVIILDGGGLVNFMNQAAGDFFGVDVENALGDPLQLRVPGLEWESMTRERKVVSRDLEVFYPENRFLNVYVAPISDEALGDKILGHVVIIRDITKERRLEAEKIESETLNVLTMLAAGVAHEIGNPLNSLNIHLQLAQRKLKRAPEALRNSVMEVLEVARNEIKRLDLIIGHFLAAVRPSVPQLEPHDLARLIREAVRVLGPEIEDRKIEVCLDLGDGVPLIPADGNQLKQAFYNLIRNACQALGNGGMLQIRISVDEDNVYVEFIDDGVGISAEDMANLFRPYFTTKSKGSGLGLLIVRRIIREHGGEIKLESEVDLGTKVTCIFPRAEKRVRLLESRAHHDSTPIDL